MGAIPSWPTEVRSEIGTPFLRIDAQDAVTIAIEGEPPCGQWAAPQGI
jgi:hypothetical protein